MFGSYLSPLAPAAVLLLSAFILFFIAPLSPAQWRTHPRVQNFLAVGLMGGGIASLLLIRLTFGADATGEGLEELSSWRFSAKAIAALNIRADEISLPFLILSLLLLLVMALMTSPLYRRADLSDPDIALQTRQHWRLMSRWLLLGATTCALFVSANILTINYTLLIFDILLTFYWFRQDNPDLAVARLFLGILTVSTLSLTGALGLAEEPALNHGIAPLLLGLALWLRLAFFPFIELAQLTGAKRTRAKPGWQGDDECSIYVGLTLIVTVFVVVRVVAAPLPAAILWLTAIAMVLAGTAAWLSDRFPLLLLYVVLTEMLLLLLAAPLPTEVSVGTVLILTLGLIALWVTPWLGRPHLTERAWLWPYLPAGAAILSWVGLPLSLGWLMRTTIYQTLLSSSQMLLLVPVLGAEMLALSSLVRYWLALWQGQNGNRRRLTIGVIVMVPFLLPGLAPFVLSRITLVERSTYDLEKSAAVFVMMIALLLGALMLGNYRESIKDRLKISSEMLTTLTDPRWVWHQSGRWLRQTGDVLLRMDVVLEGQHYIGWAIFVALVGVLVILLRT